MMYGRFERLRAGDERTAFYEFIQQCDIEELSGMFNDRISTSEAPKILDDILRAYTDSEVCQDKKRKFVQSTLTSLTKVKVTTVLFDALINRIVLDVPRCNKHQLVKLVDFCTEGIRCSSADNDLKSWKDLIPPLLEALEREKYVSYRGAELSGSEYKSSVVKSICHERWNTDLLPPLAKMFGDMGLGKSDRIEVLSALCSALDSVPLNLIPPFVYQTLKLCRRQDSRYLLNALCRYFESHYSLAATAEDADSVEDIGAISLRELQDVESTVLYHIYQAAQLNHECVKDYVRYLKSVSSASDCILRPFVLGLLLSISNVYEEQVFEILRAAIASSIQEEEKRRECAWLRQTLPSARNVTRVVETLLENSKKDRRQVLKGLSDLAFTLIAAEHDPKGSALSLRKVGTEILQELMRKRHETVAAILRESVDRLITGSEQSSHYSDCLAYACRKLTTIVLDQQVSITELLDRLTCLPSTVAGQVLDAVFPLVQVSVNVRENVILSLRKALYRKGTAKRQMAVSGFLEMLKYLRVHSLGGVMLSQRCRSYAYTASSSSTSTLTQVTLEGSAQCTSPFPKYDKSFCCEILTILNKCFTYEFEVRLHLYRGLYEAAKKNPEITEPVLDMLLTHFNVYFEVDENALPPLKFELCTDLRDTEVTLHEPIADLLFLLQKMCFDVTNWSERPPDTLDKLLGTFDSLTGRMITTELEHLNLDNRTTESFEDAPKAQRKLENLKLAISTYEALMAFEIGKCFADREETVARIEKLFKAYTHMVDFAKRFVKLKKYDGKAKKEKDANSTTVKKFGKLNNVKLPNTVMDLSVICKSLTLLYSRTSADLEKDRDGCTALIANRPFHLYVLQTCADLLHSGKCLDNDEHDAGANVGAHEPRHRKDSRINVYTEIAELLYNYWLVDLKDTLRREGVEAAVVALECLKDVCCVACDRFPACLPNFLSTIRPMDRTTRDLDTLLQDIVLELHTVIKAFLDERSDSETSTDGAANLRKVPLLLLEILDSFSRKLDFERCESEKILERTRKLACMTNVDSSVAIVILQRLLRFEECIRVYGETPNEICLELAGKLGTVDEAELTSSGRYKILHDGTTLQSYSTLNGCIKEKLGNASWLLGRIKAEEGMIRTPGSSKDAFEEALREKERSLCKRLSYIIQTVHTLANTAINSGPSTDLTFKNLQQLYNLLGSLTKYFYAKSSGQNAAFQSVKFIQAIQLAGKPLKSAFYNLVTYVEENQNKMHSKSDTHARRNKVLKETKLIPRVVYEIEQFNKEVLLLGKRTDIPLENYMKHSVTRDFRIKNSQLVEGLEKMDVSKLISQCSTTTDDVAEMSSTVDSVDGDNDRGGTRGTPSKKRRTS